MRAPVFGEILLVFGAQCYRDMFIAGPSSLRIDTRGFKIYDDAT